MDEWWWAVETSNVMHNSILAKLPQTHSERRSGEKESHTNKACWHWKIVTFVIWIMNTNYSTVEICIIDAVADELGAFRWVKNTHRQTWVIPIHFQFLWSNVNDFILFQDICGIICAIMTWLLILYAEFVVMVVIIWPSPFPVYSTVNMVIFNLLAFLAYASHIRTMFSDPVRKSLWNSFLFDMFVF